MAYVPFSSISVPSCVAPVFSMGVSGGCDELLFPGANGSSVLRGCAVVGWWSWFVSSLLSSLSVSFDNNI